MAVSIAAGLSGGLAAALLLLAIARPWASIGAVVVCLVAGFTTLLLVYPRWESDL